MKTSPALLALLGSSSLWTACATSPGGPDAAPNDAHLAADSAQPADAAPPVDATAPVDAAHPTDAAPPADVPTVADAGAPYYTGVNLSGAEFNPSALPGMANSDYTYPTHAEFDYFRGHGMSIVRLPFLWERLQPTLGAAFDAAELARLDAAVSYGTDHGTTVLIDPHDYARYRGQVIGQSGAGVSTAQFADFWSRLATHFAANHAVWFGLMNEPNGMATELWLTDANAAIAAIRGAGATQWILVPGNGYTGAHSWAQNYYGTPNATVMSGVVDPMDHYLFEMHQYLDSDSSGTHADCVSATDAAATLHDATAWLRAHGHRALLGEIGTGSSAACLTSLDALLGYMDANRDAWAGYTWWAAGAWWGTYMFSIEPTGTGGTTDAPQMAVLDRHRGT